MLPGVTVFLKAKTSLEVKFTQKIWLSELLNEGDRALEYSDGEIFKFTKNSFSCNRTSWELLHCDCRLN